MKFLIEIYRNPQNYKFHYEYKGNSIFYIIKNNQVTNKAKNMF